MNNTRDGKTEGQVAQVSSEEAALWLGISKDDIATLETQGILHPLHKDETQSFFALAEIKNIKSKKNNSLADEAAQVGVQIQRDIASSLVIVKRILAFAGFGVVGYVVLLFLFTLLFNFFPLQTAQWLGLTTTQANKIALAENTDKTVLGASTNTFSENTSPLQALLQPISRASLDIVKYANPSAYNQVSQVTILDTNDIFVPDDNGTMTLLRPIKIANSSQLQVDNPSLITNLNSQFIQGKQPGNNIGDLAVVGSIPSANPIPPIAPPAPSLPPPEVTPITNLTNANLSGSAGITNANLANSGLTITTTGPLTGGGTVSLGGALTIECPTCTDETATAITFVGDENITSTDDGTGIVTLALSDTPSFSGLTLSGLGAGIVRTDTAGVLSAATIESSDIAIGAVDLTSQVASILPVANGGTGQTSFSENGILYGNGTDPLEVLAPGTPGYVLQTNGTSSAPSWVSATGLSVDNANQLLGSTWASPQAIGSITPNSGAFTTLDSTSINGLTITNNGTNTLTIATGKTLTANNSLTFAGTDGTNFILPTTNDTLIGRDSNDTLSNKTISAGSNTISGLTAANLTAGDYASKITSGTYAINVLGSAASFSGALTGDVTGNQSATSVTRINGSLLGTTTPTAGSLLIGNGTAWITQVLTGDATIDGSGILTLKDTGTAGTYGNGTSIPIFTTDAKGRVTGASTTSISGLSASQLASTNISQWTNNAGYITANSTDTLTNKTLAAGSNTITGLTNANLSGSAGITNANLANSTLLLAGNTGSGSAPLGGTLSAIGTGIASVTASGSTLTIAATEADTLQSVYARNNTITAATGSGIVINATNATLSSGNTNGLSILGPTIGSSIGNFSNLFLGTSSSSSANTIDQATIAIGDIASTAQQNFATLNLKNGGTGYLDIEVIKGFMNFQGINQLYDDFTGKSLNTTNLWTANSTGSGSSCGLLSGGLNGLLRMTAGGAANRRCEVSTQSTLSNGYYQRTNNPVFETKLKIDTTTNVRIFAGFTNTAPSAGSDTNANTHHAYIQKLATGTQFQCVTDNGGATETVTSTGVTIAANTFYRLRVELRNGSTPQAICTVDSGTTVTRTVVTATQPGATTGMDIYEKVETSNSTAKNMDVDYIRVWQDDPAEEEKPVESPVTITPAPTEEKNDNDQEASPSATITETVATILTDAFHSLVEFFGNVIFHADVTFLGHLAVNNDTAGTAQIKAGETEVTITFEKEYSTPPVVLANVTLLPEATPNDIPSYAISDITTTSFKIVFSQPTIKDIHFSWMALEGKKKKP